MQIGAYGLRLVGHHDVLLPAVTDRDDRVAGSGGREVDHWNPITFLASPVAHKR